MSGDADTDAEGSGSGSGQPPESVVVTRVSRLIVPFVVTLGLFTMFHGTTSVGGGFQGGVVVGATVVTLAFAFGLDQTADWLREPAVLSVATVGVLGFAAVGVGSVLLGAAFLEFGAYPVKKAVVYGIEFVEVGIGVTVAATVVVLLFGVAEHYGDEPAGRPGDDHGSGGERR